MQMGPVCQVSAESGTLELIDKCSGISNIF